MELTPFRKPAAIVDRLVEFITANDMKVGDKLPAEHELMAAMAVGRSSLREAIRKLEAMNIIVVRHGTGTFLSRTPMRGEVMVPLVIDQECESLLQALDIRRALESHAAALAARVASPTQIAAIEARLIAMEHVHLEKGVALEEDLQFHLAIYEATNNPLFEQVIGPVRGPFRLFFSQPLDRRDFGASSFPLHRQLYEAIARRDSEGSRLKTLELLGVVEEEIRTIAAEGQK